MIKIKGVIPTTTVVSRFYFVLSFFNIIKTNTYISDLRVHASVPQGCFCTPSPTQGWPPWAGAGLVQVRVRIRSPPPHVFVQVVHAFQSPHIPSTGANCNLC